MIEFLKNMTFDVMVGCVLIAFLILLVIGEACGYEEGDKRCHKE